MPIITRFWAIYLSPRDELTALRRSRASGTRVGSRLGPPRKRSEGETTTDCRSSVVVGVIGDAGSMWNGDGQTAGHPGIRNSGISVETLGEVMIHVERPLVEGACTGSAETGRGRAGRRLTEVVLTLLIPGESEVRFAAVGVLRACPPDLHQLFRIKIVVFDAAHDVPALVRGTNTQRVRRIVLPDVFVAGKKLERVPCIFESDHNGVVVGHDAIYGVARVDQIDPGDLDCIDAVDGRLIWRRQTLRPQQG